MSTEAQKQASPSADIIESMRAMAARHSGFAAEYRAAQRWTDAAVAQAISTAWEEQAMKLRAREQSTITEGESKHVL